MKNYLLTFGIFALCSSATPGFASTASICDGVTGNLVSNCGFETGNFSGWMVLNDDGNTNIERNSFTLGGGVNSGNFYATLGDESSTPTTLEQTFNDNVGSALTFSFYLATDGAANDLTVEWDGETLLSLPDASAGGYTEYSFAVTGTGSDTISFSVGGPNRRVHRAGRCRCGRPSGRGSRAIVHGFRGRRAGCRNSGTSTLREEDGVTTCQVPHTPLATRAGLEKQ